MVNKKIAEASYIGSCRKKEKKRNKKVQRLVSTVIVLLCVVFMVVGSVNVISATSNAYVLTVDG